MSETPRSGRGDARQLTEERSPFHAGEQRVQTRIGVRDQVERGGRKMIRDHMPDQHRALFEVLPLLLVGSVDDAGRLWGSFLAGEPGFVRSPTATSLRVFGRPLAGDPLAENLRVGAPLGLLGIQLETRRRNRANGRVSECDGQSFTVEVEQSYGNCKQYIQAREPQFDAALATRAGAINPEGPRLSTRASALLAETDTFFIATASAGAGRAGNGEGVDVSHRGGRPGFVRVSDGSPSELTFPDFTGNFIFNTLGNLEINPRAGIVCADFASGDVLSLTGSARVIWDGPAVAAFPGAERLVSFRVEAGFLLERALPLRFSGAVPSPQLDGTGIWADVAVR